MTRKEYEKTFREMFGIEPFTEEEVFELKALLFEMGQHKDCNCASRYNHYMNYYIEMEVRRMKELVKDEVDEEYDRRCAEYLKKRGYEVIKK